MFLAAIMVLSMVAGAAAFAGTTAADHEPEPRSVNVNDLSTVWAGETVEIDGFTDGETVEFEHEDGAFEQEVASGSTVEFDSSGAAAGEWTITGVDSGANATFVVRSEEFQEFSFDPESTSGDSTLTIDTSRTGYNVTLTADGLSGSDLNDSLDQGTLAHEGEDNESYVINVSGSSTDVGVNTSELEAGSYQFEAEVIDTGLTATANLTVEDEDETQALFVDSVSEEAGDIAEVEIDVSDANEAYVVLTSGTVDGEAVVHLNNFQEDTVTLEVNTYHLSQPGSSPDGDVFTATDATVNAASYNDTPAETPHMGDLGQHWPGGYSFTLQSYTANDPTTEDVRADDRSRLSLNERSTDAVTTYVAPGDVDVAGAEEPSDLTEDATQQDTIAAGDVAIAQVEASGIYGYAAGDASEFNQNGVHFYLLQEGTDALGNPTEERINVSDLSTATVVPDSDNNQFFVAFRPDQESDVATGDSWDLTFEVDSDNPYVGDEESETVSSPFSYEELNFEFAGEMSEDRLQVAAQNGSQIVAETNVAPGTEGDIYVLLQDATDDSGDVTVNENGELVGEFDFSDRSSGEQIEQIEASLYRDSTETISTAGIFGDGTAPSFTASGDAPDSVTVGDDASLDATVTNDGQASGEASISVTIDGEEVATNTTEIASGDSWSQSFSIPTDSEGEIDWSVDAGDSSDSGTVTVESEPEDGDGDGDGDGMDGEDGDDGNDTDTDDGDGDGDEQPGFGLVVALFALIGAALLALRRQN